MGLLRNVWRVVLDIYVGSCEMKAKWLWHEPSNTMALAYLSSGGLPLITICEDVSLVNPFHVYQLSSFINYYGWVLIGEL